ncbi:MAG TPA: hypothetical protein ENK06_11760 [Gammaproteobacteria bacterium]|nr:hypothetical protein [Gammaproteobacteria bacterium]
MDWQSIQPFFTWLSENPAWSGLIVFLIALSESLLIVGLIVPGTILMFGVGTLVGTGVLDIHETLLLAFLGAVIGDGISYGIGAYYHEQIAKLWPLKNNPDYLTRGKRYFNKHGGKSVLFGRFIGPVRPVIPAVAGMMGMSKKYFFTVNIISAAAWAPFYLIPGIVFGTSIGLASVIGMRLVVLLLVLFIGGLLGIWLLRKSSAIIVPRILLIHPKAGQVLLAGFVTVIVLLASSLVIDAGHQADKIENKKTVTFQQWQAGTKVNLPQYREDLFGRQRQAMNLQWVGQLEPIKQSLLALGWQMPQVLDYRSILFWLKPYVAINELPRIPETLGGEREVLLMVKYTEKMESALVLQLWPSAYVIKENNMPLWNGSLTRQSVAPHPKWLANLSVKPLTQKALQTFEEALTTQYAVRHSGNGVLLISGLGHEE